MNLSLYVAENNTLFTGLSFCVLSCSDVTHCEIYTI